MALLERGLKQRMIGALVLVALAVIFLPMLFSRQDEPRHVRVDAPNRPSMPAVPDFQVAAVDVPVPLPEEPIPAQPPKSPITTLPLPVPQAAQQPPVRKPQATGLGEPVAKAPVRTAEARLDANNLPVSWTVQLASLSNRANAENLQKTLRTQGYNAYIRRAGEMNRVMVGPVIEKAEAEKLRDQLNRRHKLKGYVVRFEPEKG
jgi:DedD protein